MNVHNRSECIFQGQWKYFGNISWTAKPIRCFPHTWKCTISIKKYIDNNDITIMQQTTNCLDHTATKWNPLPPLQTQKD